MSIQGKVVAIKEGKKGVKGLNINIESTSDREVWCLGPNIELDRDVVIGCPVRITGRWVADEDGNNVYFAAEAVTFL